MVLRFFSLDQYKKSSIVVIIMLFYLYKYPVKSIRIWVIVCSLPYHTEFVICRCLLISCHKFICTVKETGVDTCWRLEKNVYQNENLFKVEYLCVCEWMCEVEQCPSSITFATVHTSVYTLSWRQQRLSLGAPVVDQGLGIYIYAFYTNTPAGTPAPALMATGWLEGFSLAIK